MLCKEYDLKTFLWEEKHIKLEKDDERDGHFCLKILNGNFGNFQQVLQIFKLYIILLYL